MAANQGNWRPLNLLLKHKAKLRKPEVLAHAAEWLMSSSCYECVTRTGQQCQRCGEHRDRLHSPYCSFERCIDVLVEQGLRDLALIRKQKAGDVRKRRRMNVS
jgi:hypothetical protein